MAVYKVPQDVESDEKLIGPFTFKQFVFILIAVALMWLAWASAKVSPILSIIPLPFILAFLILGLPLRKDQPTDVYVAALINFWLKPKIRIWGQDGMIEHVHITAPKQTQQFFSDGLTSQQVHARLNQLANTLDTRGWAVKNVGVGDLGGANDRLVNTQIETQTNIVTDVSVDDDMFDTENSSVAQRFAQLEAKQANHDIHAAPRAAVATQQNEQPTYSVPGSVVNPTVGANPQDSGLRYNANGERVISIDDTFNPNSPSPQSYDPYPAIHQRVINPDGQQDQQFPQPDVNQPEPQATTLPPADTIDPSTSEGGDQAPTDSDFDQGGEISLR